MSKFNEITSKYMSDFEEFIDTFLELDDKAPFDNNLLNAIKTINESSTQSLLSSYKHLDECINKYKNEFKNIINDYYTNIDSLKSSVIKDKAEINKKYDISSSDIEKKIIRLQDENLKKKSEHEVDIDYFIMSSNQNIDMFEIEHEDNITRYSYQRENAQQSYQNSISKNNSYLEQKLKKVNEEYSYSLIDYDAETRNIIDEYNKKIASDNNELNQYINDFSSVIADHKDKKYKESVDLNDKIRKLSNEASQQNVQERTEYNNNQNTNQKEKEKKRNEYQLESQSISKEFVLNMTELDDNITKIKNDYNNNLTNEKKDLQYRLLDIHKEQEKTISNIYFSHASDKTKKRQIRSSNKSYYSYSNIEKAQSKRTIYHLDKSFAIDNENNNYNRKILELERSYSIKTINEKELYDNKYYQELNNLDENVLNYKISVINNQFNKKANLLRLASSLRNIEIDKDFTKEEALHQIKLEKLSTNIKSLKIDLESLKQIHKLLHETEDLKHEKRHNYLIVYNLLEIEKDRVLNDYNQKQYNLNVEKENELLKYSKTNIRLKNYKYKQLKYCDIAIEKEILNNDIYLLKHKDKVQNFHRDLELENVTINNQYEQDKLFVNVLDTKFRQELKSINQILSVYINAIVELKSNINNILDNIFDNIIFRPEYLDIVSSFIDRLVKIAYSYLENLSESFLEYENNVINERLSFEESFKFSLEYEIAERNYSIEHSTLSAKKNELEDQLDGYQNKINEYNSLIFTIQNQILYIKDSKNYALYNKQTAKKNLAVLTNRIETITADANQNIQLMEPLKAEINSYEAKIKQLDLEHSNKIGEIKRKQYNSTLAYHNLFVDFTNSINDLKRSLSNGLLIQRDNKLNAVNYETIINNKLLLTTNIINDLIETLYKNVNLFYVNEDFEQSKNLLDVKNNHKNKVFDANQKFNTSINFEKVKSSNTRKILNSNIRKKSINYSNVEKKCDKLIKKNNMKHIEISNDIINRTTKATETFYDEFYAICANQKSITDDYENTIKSLDDNYRNEVNKIVSDAKENKDSLKRDLQKHIEKRKNIINTLDEKTKIEKHNTSEETKRHNEDVDKNIAESKVNFIAKRKEINNNISEINDTFGKTKVSLTAERRLQLKKEKKNHIAQLRHIN